jgi:hypothetical protein
MVSTSSIRARLQYMAEQGDINDLLLQGVNMFRALRTSPGAGTSSFSSRYPGRYVSARRGS